MNHSMPNIQYPISSIQELVDDPRTPRTRHPWIHVTRYFLLTGIISFCLFLTTLPAGAQNVPGGRTITKVGTTSAQFLKIGVGAKAIAMGGTFVAQANDLSALYWNPAGLAYHDWQFRSTGSDALSGRNRL